MESFGTANGWVAVLILLGAAVFLPLLTVGITAFCLPRTTVENSEVHWAERARRLYPFKVVRIISLSVLPVLYAAANFYPDTMMPIPKWMFGCLIFLASFGSTNWIIWWLGRRYQHRASAVLGTSAKHSGSHLYLCVDLSFRGHGCHSSGSVELAVRSRSMRRTRRLLLASVRWSSPVRPLVGFPSTR
jgi:hypothetical protein